MAGSIFGVKPAFDKLAICCELELNVLQRHLALTLLDECTGRDIWPVDHCRSRGVPEAWIEELADALESNFHTDRDTIYVASGPTNQFHGVRDVDLAIKLGKELGIDVHRATSLAISRQGIVQAIKEAVEEG